MRFIGVDLAWATDTKHTGIAVMEGDAERVWLRCLSKGMRSLDAVASYVLGHTAPTTVVSIDASLIVRTRRGNERAISQTFGARGASCHSTNRGRQHFDSGGRLVEKLGFAHFIPFEGPMRGGQWVIEVYPHPAMLRLFNLDWIIRYKKGKVAEKRGGLVELQQRLKTLACLEDSEALSTLLEQDPAARRGNSLKELEDLLDATFCAYLAWHNSRWGAERNDCFGDLEHGYIVVRRSA